MNKVEEYLLPIFEENGFDNVLCKEITDKQRENFAGIKEILDNKDYGTTNVDWWYFAIDSVYAVRGTGHGYHLNKYMDLPDYSILL